MKIQPFVLQRGRDGGEGAERGAVRQTPKKKRKKTEYKKKFNPLDVERNDPKWKKDVTIKVKRLKIERKGRRMSDEIGRRREGERQRGRWGWACFTDTVLSGPHQFPLQWPTFSLDFYLDQTGPRKKDSVWFLLRRLFMTSLESRNGLNRQPAGKYTI